MSFDRPVQFRQALEAREVKAALPTTGSSAELSRLAPEIRERALFSARTTDASHLAKIDSVVRSILSASGGPGERVNEARARELLRESLQRIGYSPDQVGAAPGSLRDLGSMMRLNTIIDTNVAMARGYGWFAQGQNPAILDQWPAQELVRFEERRDRRNWHERWRAAGGQVFPGGDGQLDGQPGRLVALKNDPVWTNLNQDFGVPYPPFAWGSGVNVQDVSREDAVAIGLITEAAQVAPADRGFADTLEASVGADPQSELFDAIRRAMGAQVETDGNVLRFRRAA